MYHRPTPSPISTPAPTPIRPAALHRHPHREAADATASFRFVSKMKHDPKQMPAPTWRCAGGRARRSGRSALRGAQAPRPRAEREDEPHPRRGVKREVHPLHRRQPQGQRGDHGRTEPQPAGGGGDIRSSSRRATRGSTSTRAAGPRSHGTDTDPWQPRPRAPARCARRTRPNLASRTSASSHDGTWTAPRMGSMPSLARAVPAQTGHQYRSGFNSSKYPDSLAVGTV